MAGLFKEDREEVWRGIRVVLTLLALEFINDWARSADVFESFAKAHGFEQAHVSRLSLFQHRVVDSPTLSASSADVRRALLCIARRIRRSISSSRRKPLRCAAFTTRNTRRLEVRAPRGNAWRPEARAVPRRRRQ